LEEDIPKPVYKQTNIITCGCETKDLLEVLMVKSGDDQEADVKAVEEKLMAKVGGIKVKLEKFQNTYEETIATHVGIAHTKAGIKEKQSTKTIFNKSGENDESRRAKFRATEDDSMRSISVGSIEPIDVSSNDLERRSIESIEFDHNQSLGTLDMSESMDSIESIVFECNQSFKNLDISDSMESIETEIGYTQSLRTLDTYICFTESMSGTNLDVFESWRIFSIQEED